MIGIIVWCILIFLIACAVCPGFFTMICILLFGFIGVYAIYAMIDAVWQDSRCKQAIDKQKVDKECERAIDEWEKKWKRKHPTRINNTK